MKIKVVVLLVLLSLAVSGQEVLYLKSDSTWKASQTAPESEWFKPDYDPLTWGYSVGGWDNNPCSKFCSRLKSCEVSCIDWMWYGDSCDNCTRYFIKTIEIPGDIKSASFTISADDFYWLYVNGNFIGSDDRKLGYTNAETYDLSSILHAGTNVIGIKAEDRDSFEGVLVSGTIVYSDARQVINQLESQIKTLKAQVSNLTDDKKILQQRADSLESQLQSIQQLNEKLNKELEGFRLLNQSMNVELAKYRRDNRILLVLLVILVIAVVYVGRNVYEKYVKKRKPTLSSVPLKKEEAK